MQVNAASVSAARIGYWAGRQSKRPIVVASTPAQTRPAGFPESARGAVVTVQDQRTDTTASN